MKIVIYARCSTDDQSVEQQLFCLREWASRAGHDIVAECTDEGVSGARNSRPGLAALQRLVTRREAHMVAVTALDRLGRTVAGLATLLADWNALGVGLYSAREHIDTTTPSGKALLGMAAVFAEFERDLIVERTKAGMERARRNGKRIGRPPLQLSVLRQAEKLLASGTSQRAVRRALGLGGSTVARIKSQMEAT